MTVASYVGVLIVALAGAVAPVPAKSNDHAGTTLNGVRIEAFEGTVQGAVLVGKTVRGAQVRLDLSPIQTSVDGSFLIGFDRDASADHELEILLPDGAVQSHSLKVSAREYNVQRVDGVPPRTVSPPPEDLERIAREASLKKNAKKRDTPQTWFLEPFALPVDGPISGVFGSQRILNGKPGRPHYGLDVAAAEGTPIAAPAPGRVTLAEEDLYFEGGTVFIDHGHGLISILMHMSRVDAVVGRDVAKGDIVGAVGKTGRATGPHLHWGMIWLDAHVDPQLLIPAAAPDNGN